MPLNNLAKKTAIISISPFLLGGIISCSAIENQQRQQALLVEYSQLTSELVNTKDVYAFGVKGEIKNCTLAKSYLEKWQKHSDFLELNPSVFGAFNYTHGDLSATSKDLISKLKLDLRIHCQKSK